LKPFPSSFSSSRKETTMLKKHRGSLLVVALLAIVMTVVAVQGAFANGDPAGNAITRVKTVTNTGGATTTSGSYVALTSATTTIAVAPGQTALLLARFSAQSQCTGASGSCSVEIFVDGTAADPVSTPANFAFDSASAGGAANAREIDRSMVVSAGVHTVQVRYAVAGATSFRLSHWSLTVERSDQ